MYLEGCGSGKVAVTAGSPRPLQEALAALDNDAQFFINAIFHSPHEIKSAAAHLCMANCPHCIYTQELGIDR